jgi:hypothetical protein
MIIAKRGQKLKQRFGLAEILTNLCASQRRNCAPGSLTTVPFRPGLVSCHWNGIGGYEASRLHRRTLLMGLLFRGRNA